METLGIIGVGQLAGYLIAGLRRGGDRRRILLAPRNLQTAKELALQHQCEVLDSNQAVADQSDIVLLATRPEQSLPVLQKLVLREDQLLLSVAAGVSLKDLESFAQPASVARCLPLAPAEVCAGATPLIPKDPRAENLLKSIVTVVTVETEEQFEMGGVAGCIGGWVFQLVAELQQWLQQAGMSESQARTLAIETFHGATGLAREKPELVLQQQADEIGREGTYTKMFIDDFRARGGFKALHDSSDALLANLEKA
ncbi:pyrroline-5-carboxylate reductase [Motiliproteus sp. MSK22-1]|uniref:pyrroline-5-carboxylate reductase family protein n=1 Tax=Motiliproteus sp. MSK22-1 TaxID=1897630 RepID=UPI000975AC6E|nr:NAD(P)-binding domain-containing protein [Motiliproteus sp. MSK22-1]OMH25826.1 hypothetical protein BGP75_25230 [Motiliproteus sp. MSK22-1]